MEIRNFGAFERKTQRWKSQCLPLPFTHIEMHQLYVRYNLELEKSNQFQPPTDCSQFTSQKRLIPM